MPADEDIRREILEFIPQKPPFRFVDEIICVNDEQIVGVYRFREDEYFYRGHFPDYPVTPGVILIETMAQVGVVAFGIYLLSRQKNMHPRHMQLPISLFSFADAVEFKKIVKPGERVIVTAKKIYFRKNTIKASVSMDNEQGDVVCSGILSGVGVDQ